jgi:arsenate reductase
MSRKVLFVCTHNSARSQIAEAFLNALYGGRYEGYSAGVTPGKINPYVVKSMSEIGVDISGNRSKSIEEFRGKKFDYVVTVCDSAREACPFFPGEKVIHKGFEDPSQFTGSEEEILKQVRRVRDEVREWINETFG